MFNFNRLSIRSNSRIKLKNIYTNKQSFTFFMWINYFSSQHALAKWWVNWWRTDPILEAEKCIWASDFWGFSVRSGEDGSWGIYMGEFVDLICCSYLWLNTMVGWVCFQWAYRNYPNGCHCLQIITLGTYMLFSSYCHILAQISIILFMGVYSESEVQWWSTFVLFFSCQKSYRANFMIKMCDQMGWKDM